MWLSFTKSTQTFGPELFNNYFGLERYMSGEDAIKQIEAQATEPLLLRKPTILTPYFGCSRVFWICFKSPVSALLSGACALTALLLNSIWMARYAVFFEVAAQQLTRDWEQVVDQWLAKSPLLVPAANFPQIAAWDVYTCGPSKLETIVDSDVTEFVFRNALVKEGIDRAYEDFQKKEKQSRWKALPFDRSHTPLEGQRCKQEVISRDEFHAECRTDPWKAMSLLKKCHEFDGIQEVINELYVSLMRSFTLAQSYDQIDLYHPKGECRGASEWFIHLFLKSKSAFADREEHAIAIAKQFEQGVPGQAIVLQSLVNTQRLLKEKTTEMKEHSISAYELAGDEQACLSKIQELPAGIYRVSLPFHSIVLMKFSDELSYVWDVECGLYEKSPQDFLSYVLENYYEKNSPANTISFTHYDLDNT